MPEFVLGVESPFSLDYTLESGQVFRWERRGEWWYGVVSGGVVRIQSGAGVLQCASSSENLGSAFLRSYFRLDEDFESVLASITKDELMKEAIQKFYGLRLIRQERWECLASFLLATNSNIPRIKKMVASICERFGEPIGFEGARFRAFPTPGTLAEAKLGDLKTCGLGYRAPFLKRVASAVAAGRIDLSLLSEMGYAEAKSELLRELTGEKVLLGVGPKVADCLLLFSCGMDEAFPIDVWISRELTRSYPKLIPRKISQALRSRAKANLTLAEYCAISRSVRNYFGENAGYAQQYLYLSARFGEKVTP